jgi:hypothetical protein
MCQSLSPAYAQAMPAQVWKDLTAEAQHQTICLMANLVFKWIVPPTTEASSEDVYVTATPQHQDSFRTS